jgi:predicted phage terminase large subunit-like protein
MPKSATSSEGLLAAVLANPAAALRELDRLDCEESLYAFVEKAWPVLEPAQPFVPGWHIEAICLHLEAVTEGRIARLLVNVPPGSSKSMIVSVLWPAWEWGPKNRPATRFVTASHTQKLSERDSLRMRRLVTSDWYQELWGDRVSLTKDQATKIKFENTATGFRDAMAAGSITGARGDRVIIDDPLSVEDARHEAIREGVNEWFREAVPTRLNNPDRSAIVVIMQRLHEDDVSGVILANNLGYVHLMIPMEYDPSRHCSTQIGWEDPRSELGELMCPDRFSRSVVERDKRTMGPFAAAGQFQQQPVPRGGGIFQIDWWQVWPPGGEDRGEDGRPKQRLEFPEMHYVLASVDTAMTEKQENDPSALTIWGVFSDEHGRPKIMLMDAWELRLEFRPLVEKIIETCRRRRVDRLLIEAKANGISVGQEIARLCTGEEFGTTLVQVKAQDSKEARAYSVQHLFESGLIYAPERKYAQMVIDQCSVFPKGKHDDLVDSTTHALRALRDMGLAKLVEEHEDDMRRQFAPAGPRRPIYDV